MRKRQALASAAYRDPEQRARYQAAYEAWLESEHKRGRYTHMYKGKHVRYLWDYMSYPEIGLLIKRIERVKF